MISILAQERLIGAALGASVGSAAILFEKISIEKSTARAVSRISGHPIVDNQPRVPELLFDKRTRSNLAHTWNVSIDKSLGALIAFLASKGW